ncbi:MAG TPA: hypothetical protein VD995_04570, partial [Azospirillum sp.]|nr:hypothetical protein [Azospirillum sp.]
MLKAFDPISDAPLMSSVSGAVPPVLVSWSPFPGQFCGWDKLGSGPCHAANPIPAGMPWWTSAGVLPPSAECG